MRVILAATIASFLLMGKAQAHEFWIDARDYSVDPRAVIEADLRVGQEFEGQAYGYFPQSYTRFEVWMGDEVRPVEGRMGDTPALSMEGLPDGLAVVAFEAVTATITYDNWEQFVNFAEHKDFGDIAAMQDARGLPRVDFTETYTRHAKALIAIGAGAGADQELGLTIEIVALANPYTDDISGGLPVQVFYLGAAQGDVQVELFERAPDDTVEITLHRTNADGIAMLPVRAGYEYLADHVVLEPIEPETNNGAVWHSYWAALTFGVAG